VACQLLQALRLPPMSDPWSDREPLRFAVPITFPNCGTDGPKGRQPTAWLAPVRTRARDDRSAGDFPCRGALARRPVNEWAALGLVLGGCAAGRQLVTGQSLGNALPPEQLALLKQTFVQAFQVTLLVNAVVAEAGILMALTRGDEPPGRATPGGAESEAAV
jgi:hypothetical protein